MLCNSREELKNMKFPLWLPRLFDVTQWSHDTHDLLYEIFHKDFIQNPTHYLGQRIGFEKIIEEGKEKAFWHITTREDKESGERFTDLRRCERLPWLKPILENAGNPEILSWEYTEGDGVIKVYVWLKDYDYVAIMKKTRKGFLILLTAFWVEHEYMKRALMKKYNSRNGKANA